MKKLIANIIVFMLPVLLLIAILPVNNRLKYQGLKNDCFNHGIWIHDRIFENDKPIDLAFIGSSHTITGVNDEIISKGTKFGEAVNLGYCRFGRNFSYVLLKEILSAKKIGHLILEVRGYEDRYSHNIFPYIGSSKDVLLPNAFFNRDILVDMWTHLGYKIDLFQHSVYKHEAPAPISTIDYGFASPTDTASIEWLEKVKVKRHAPEKPMSELEQNFHSNFSRVYLKKISELCKENNIPITFLYLPEYGTPLDRPSEYELYRTYGDVLIPPKVILEKPTNWHDENHLNLNGGNELSLWLIDQLNVSIEQNGMNE